MPSSRSVPLIDSIAQLMRLPARGESFVFAVPTKELASLLLRSALREAPAPVRLFSALQHEQTSHPGKSLRIPVETARTARRFQALAEKEMRAGRRNEIWMFDSANSWPAGPKAFVTFFSSAAARLRKLHITSFWLIAEEEYTDKELGSIRGVADFFLHSWFDPGTGEYVCQLISGPSSAPTEVFRPVTLRLAGGEARIVPGQIATTRQEENTGADFYRSLFTGSSEGMILFDPTGSFRRQNREAERILGYSSAELVRLPFSAMIVPADLRRALRSLLQLRKSGKASGTFGARKRNGRTAVISMDAYRLDQGLACCVVRDVSSDHREAAAREEGLAAFSTVFHESAIPQAILRAHRLILWNNAFAAAFGLSAEGRRPSFRTILGKKNSDLCKEIERLEIGSLEQEVVIRSENRDERRFRLSAGPVMFQNGPAVYCQLVDVTKERRILDELSEMGEDLRRVIDRSPAAVALVAGDEIRFANNTFGQLLAYPDPGGVIGKSILTVVSKSTAGQMERAMKEAHRSGETRRLEVRAVRSDRSRFDALMDISPGSFKGGPVSLCYLRDTSDLGAEKERRRRESDAFRSVQNIQNAFDTTLSLDEMIRSGGEEVRKDLRADLCWIGLTIPADGSVHEKFQTGMSQRLQREFSDQPTESGLLGFVLKTSEPLVLDVNEYPSHLPHRSLFVSEGIQAAVLVPLLSGSSPVGILMAGWNTRRSHSEELTQSFTRIGSLIGRAVATSVAARTVAESHSRLLEAVEAVSDVLYRARPDGGIVMISGSSKGLFGYEPSDFYRSPELWRSIVHPDDRAVYGRKIAEDHSSDGRLTIEYRIVMKGKATYRWVRDSISYQVHESGALTGLIGIVSPIDEYKLTSEETLPADSIKADIVESVREGVAVYDADLRCIEWNSAMSGIAGMERADALGKSIHETTVRIASIEFVEMLKRGLQGEAVSSDDIVVESKRGGEKEEAFYWVRCFPLRDRSGETHGVVMTFTDVTARRALEQSVRESEETLRNVIDGMGDALMICDLQGRVWEVNREFTRITGFSRSEVLGMSFPYPWLVDEEMARFVTWISEIRERNFLRDFDMTWHSREGASVAISINTTLLRKANGEPVAMLNIARDISDRKRLMTELERRNRELVALNEISSSISRSLHVDEVLHVAGTEIKEIMSCRIVLIYLRDPRQNRLRLGCHIGLPEGMAGQVRELHPSESATGSVIEGGTPLLISTDLLEDPRITRKGREVLRKLQLKSLGVIPIRSKDNILGALDVAFDDEHQFNDTEQQFLIVIGSQLGSALENAQLYDEVNKQVRRLTSLYEVGRGLTGALDFRTILQTVHDHVRKEIPSCRLTYYSWSERTNGVVPLCDLSPEEGTTVWSAGQERFLADDDPIALAIRQGTPRFSAVDEDGTRRLLFIAPMKSKQTIVGILAITGATEDAADQSHLRLLESIANLTEIALDKASMYIDIVKKSEEIETRNKELDDFTYVVSHDLKEPLISIEGYSKILLKEFESVVGEEGKEFLASLVHSSSRLKNLIDDLLTLSRLGRSAEVPQPVSARMVVEEVLKDIRFTLRERHAAVELPDNLPDLRYNPTQLGMVFRNLISNGIKFNTNPTPHVRIEYRMEGGFHVISVTDNGIGIEDRYHEKIFMIFQRLHRNEEYRGTGAGLTIVKKIVEIHGGTISVVSEPERGSTFTFTIPAQEE